MRLTFLGGAREIGASSALLEIGGKRILIDAGIRPSPSRAPQSPQSHLPRFDRLAHTSFDLVLLTHAHIDHMGAVPQVARKFPHVPFIATEGTCALMNVMLPQSAELAERQAKTVESARELVVTPEEVSAALRRTHMAQFEKWFSPFPDAEARVAFFPAGHILGAAMIAIEVCGERILFTGDFSVKNQVTMPGFSPFDFAPDVVVMESTYGCTEHLPRQEQAEDFSDAIARAIGRGGKVLIPAFAVGRSQEILALLHREMQVGRIPAVPVYFDGLVRETTECYVRAGALAPFSPQGLIHPVTSKDDGNAILAGKAPCVIVATAGNLAGGPAVRYAKALLPDPRNAVLLAGYQDEESPGRKLLEHLQSRRSVVLEDEKISVLAEVGLYPFSAHADCNELKALVEAFKPKAVVLNHGEWDVMRGLAHELADDRPVWVPDAKIVFDPLTADLQEFLQAEQACAHGAVRKRAADARRIARLRHKRATETPEILAEKKREDAYASSMPPVRNLSRHTIPELLARVHPVQKILGIEFRNPRILLTALTHSSLLNESSVAGLDHNERLEYLGDAVIEYIITLQLYRRFPGVPEGALTNFRMLLVNGKALAGVAENMGIAQYILTSRGEREGWEKGFGAEAKARFFILANAFEALVGAIHEDRGLGIAELFVAETLFPKLEEIAIKGILNDPKSALQELAQEHLGTTPHYRIASETGPDHNKWFTVEVLFGSETAGRGEGLDKQAARMAAATDGLRKKFGVTVEDLRVQLSQFASRAPAGRSRVPSVR